MKFHKQKYTYKHQEKTIDMVTLEQVKRFQKIFTSYQKTFRVIVKDDGRIVMVFLNSIEYEKFMMATEKENEHGDVWIQYGEEKTFSFSDEYNNYNLIVAEFRTEARIEDELDNYFNDVVNDYFGVKEDDGKYTIWDVYSESELL